jgi:hypothetical protein
MGQGGVPADYNIKFKGDLQGRFELRNKDVTAVPDLNQISPINYKVYNQKSSDIYN